MRQLEEKLNSPHLYQADKPDTLSQLEEAVNSPHINSDSSVASTDSARVEVNKALSAATTEGIMPPIEALNAQPLGLEMHPTVLDFSPQEVSANNFSGVSSPPPVPPPIPFDFGKSST